MSDDAYAVGHITAALAGDPRVGEQGLEVTVTAGRVFVHGTVPTPERRDAVTAVVAELAPGLEVRNETKVATYAELDEPEELS